MKGRYFKDEQEWKAEIIQLGISASGTSSHQCLQNLVTKIEKMTKDEKKQISLKIDNDGIFYIVAPNKPLFLNFIVCCLADTDPTGDLGNLEEWLQIEIRKLSTN